MRGPIRVVAIIANRRKRPVNLAPLRVHMLIRIASPFRSCPKSRSILKRAVAALPVRRLARLQFRANWDSGKVLGKLVSVTHYFLDRPPVVRPTTVVLAVLLLIVVLLQVAFVLGAQDCVSGADSTLCGFAEAAAG